MKRVRWGVIGAGGIADRRTIPGLLQAKNAELSFVMDIERADAIAKKYGVGKYSARIDDILSDAEIDAVYIATPVPHHLDHIVAVAEAGKHILCEKPLAMSAAQAREAVAACARNNVKLQEGYMMKFHGAHRKIREIVASGRLGELVHLRAQLSCWYPPIDGAWRQRPGGGGGAVMDMAVHLYDLLEYCAGRIVRVGADVRSRVHAYQPEDSSVTLLRFAGGATATVDCFFNIPDQAAGSRLELYGTRGSVLTEGTIGQDSGGRMMGTFVPAGADYDAQQDRAGNHAFEEIPFARVDMYQAEIQSFGDCLLRGEPITINDGANSIHILQVAEKVYESARTGTFRDVEES